MSDEKPTYRPDRLIKDAAKHGQLVVFVGAGVSKLCGSPDWKGFSNQVVDVLENFAGMPFLEAEQLRGIGDPRRTLSIAMAIAHEKAISMGVHFDRILHPEKPNAEGLSLYELLSSLNPVFVTTNYDKWLDIEGPEKISIASEHLDSEGARSGPVRRQKYHRKEHLTLEKLSERGAVIHLHGSYTEPESMVVSLKDYIEHYADEGVKAFLSEMFRNYTVLFVGYGLAELEVLDHIIRSNESSLNGSEPRHFILYAHRSSEAAQTTFIKRFFKDQCGVQVLPYCIDKKGYTELLDVFRAWEPELDVRDPTLLDLQSYIDRCVSGGGATERRSALLKLAKKPELVGYLFSTLKDPAWFPELEAAGYFNSSYNPEVIQVLDGTRTAYQAIGWPALRYLETISSEVDNQSAVKIISILRSVTSDAISRNIDNWRTWWSLATVLSRLPLEVIEDSDVEMIRVWFSGKFDADMVCHELGKQLMPRLLDSQTPSHWGFALSLAKELSALRSLEVQP